MTAEGLDLPPPWEVQHGNETILQYGNSSDMPEDKKLLGHCVPGCTNYGFDPDFWEATMVTEWDLVCEKSWLKTLAKLLLFTGLTILTHVETYFLSIHKDFLPIPKLS